MKPARIVLAVAALFAVLAVVPPPAGTGQGFHR